ncbi:MAG: sterol-binding protein [Betaproteobacteria bacterium]|nr:sterol-binding protein [Betaproteobacteria bacterium]
MKRAQRAIPFAPPRETGGCSPGARAMQLPSPHPLLRELVSRLPQYPPAAAAALVLNLALGGILNARNLPSARGKVIAIAVPDVGLQLAFAFDEEGLIARGNARPDATIRADARDFLALARREVDPDALFFGRRLAMEGDTELALLVKNTLDTLDFRALPLPTPGRVLAALRLQLRGLL